MVSETRVTFHVDEIQVPFCYRIINGRYLLINGCVCFLVSNLEKLEEREY